MSGQGGMRNKRTPYVPSGTPFPDHLSQRRECEIECGTFLASAAWDGDGVALGTPTHWSSGNNA